MKDWRWKLQPAIPYSSNECTEPKFAAYESYYLTWYDDNYGNAGPYGDPIPTNEGGFFHDFSSSGYGGEEIEFAGRHWNENGPTDETMQLPHGGGGGGDWLGEYKSYIVGWCGEDTFSDRYGPYEGGLEKGEEQCDSYYSYDDKIEMESSYDHNNSWLFGYGFGLGNWVYEDNHGYGLEENESSYGQSSEEMRLCEKIFGHWPSLLRPDQESLFE